ncbi:MAG: hypothetical protein DRQ13_04135 [Ignavibacteriae bacterium]|nr:MAG: hypothetical protein DRQ13_04135 [Ignavibacteriota bacterium]
MEITFIGTGSGKASLKREHSSILISSKKFNLLIDAGDGISKAFLKSGIDFNSVDGIIFSHLHPDHYTGLAALIVQMKMYNRTEPLTIFVHEELLNVIKNFIINSYLFPERLGFKINYQPFAIKKLFSINEEVEVLADQNSHLTELTEYKNYSNISFACLSFLFKVGEKRIHYTGDIGGKDDLYLFKDMKTGILITETTHISFNEIFHAAEKNNPSKIILTHITEDDESKLNFDLEQLPEELKKKTIIATDGLKIKL